MIPKNINRNHILKAINEIEINGIPKSRQSKKYRLIFNGKQYPPKYVISLANRHANGSKLEPAEFSGGHQANSFLERLGFRISKFSSKLSVKPRFAKRRPGKQRWSKHDERCPECKTTVERMLRKIYGKVEVNHELKAGTKPEDYKEAPFYPEITEIFSRLQNHRGHKNFVKSKTLPRCDFFVLDPGFIVEFDESQHFTACRKIALSNYPRRLELRFDRERWIKLCEKIDAKDNDPPYRDEQRAWYDTLRDFIPTIKGFEPTVRMFSRDLQWCSLNPNVPTDVSRFKTILERRKQEWRIEVRGDANPSLARIIIAGKKEWDGDVRKTRELLEDVCENWPEGKRVGFLITCGGFIEFRWPESLPDIGDNKNPNPSAVKCLEKQAEKQCQSLLEGLFEKLQNCTDYLTIGVDSQKAKISTTRNYISKPHVELVCLVDLKTKKISWTGKSYPTSNQEKGLVRICDLKSHFFESDLGKVMLLGCHDLTIFNNRNWKNTKGWRKELKIKFRELAKKEKPKIVLQHPHTTDCVSVWTPAWHTLRKKIPTVEEYASAGRWPHAKYHFYKRGKKRGKPHCDISKVREKTKCGNSIDFVVHMN